MRTQGKRQRKLRVVEAAENMAASNGVQPGLEFELPKYIPFLINRVAAAMLRFSSHEFHKVGLTVPGFRILTVLRQKRACRFGTLAETTSIEPPSLTRHIRELRKQGLVQQRRDPTDSRSVIISLTPAGRSHIEEMLPSALKMGEQILEGMTATEAKVLERILQRIYQNLQRHADDWEAEL